MYTHRLETSLADDCNEALRSECSDDIVHVTGVLMIHLVFISCTLVIVQGKKEVAKALRVFVDQSNYPVLVHCIHGKDRTGLIVMLIILLCSVEPEVPSSNALATLCMAIKFWLNFCRKPSALWTMSRDEQ